MIFKEACRDCKTLRTEWYEYLAASGYEDPDPLDSTELPALRVYEIKDFQSTAQFEAKKGYHDWARSKVNDGKFQSVSDKLIWECHADGMPRRQIAPRVGLEHSWISRKINRIENYLKEQVELITNSSMSGYAVGR